MLLETPRITLDDRVRALNESYRHHSATAVLERALHDAEVGNLALVSSFGAESVVLLHLVSVVAPGTPVIFIDTQMLFPETLEYQRELAEKLNLTDDEIAAVMGHEIAHAVAKHSVERASRNVATNVLLQVTDFLSGGKLSTINRTTGMDTVGLLTQMGILNPFNRKQESEADYLGLIFASLSGYDIRETVKVWERMKEANKGKEPPEFMSTHPSSDNRIKKITEWINEVIVGYPPIKQAE